MSCSEDQTALIWSFSEGKPTIRQKLSGHTKAVTSVDWQIMEIGEILATCSDDRKIRIYELKGKNFELREEVYIDFVKEWFTLTYIALEKAGRRLACVAQNGFLFVYNLQEKRFEFSERVHLGSCEGLVWGEFGKLVSCAADLTIQVVEIQKI